MTNETTAAEPLTGRAGLENDAGFTPLVDEVTPESEAEELSKKEAADRLAQLSSSKPIVTYTSGLPPDVSLTIEQGAKMVAEARTADREQAELDADKALKKEVDELRPKSEPVAPLLSDEDEVERALKLPRVKAALDQRVTEADTARETYTKQVGLANQFAAAAFTEGFPELARLPLDQMADALTAMAHREPARFDKAMATLQRVNQLQQAAAHETAQKTAREAAEFQAYARAEDARVVEMIKGERNMPALEAEIPSMLRDLGVDPAEFLRLGNESKFLRSAAAQKILIDATKYRLAMKAGRPKPGAAPIPQVVRPGTRAEASRGARAASDLAALNHRLSKSGSLKDAAALLVATRKQGRR